MSLSQILKKELNDKGVGDIIKAFTLAIKTEQVELALNQSMLRHKAHTSYAKIYQKRIDDAQEEISSLKFTFQQLTGLQFGSDLEIQ